VCTHAIGDRANTIILNVYENALRSHAPGDYRLRVEHAQVLDPNDIPRFAKLGVLASMQPIHCTSDMKWVEAVIGPKRARNAYAWHSLLQSGATIAGGSDFPVESANPLLGIYAACTRKDTNGVPNSAADVTHSFALSPEGIQDATAFQDGWYASQRMTREEAVRCFTTSAAYAAFEEQLKGSLKEGTLADFVVLSGDLFTVPISRIPSLVVEQTYLGGERVFSRDIAFSPKSL
jgi:predicted amidohydrolase YtcJ